MEEAIKKINPQNILIYGTIPDFDFGKINIKHYDSRKFEVKNDSWVF